MSTPPTDSPSSTVMVEDAAKRHPIFYFSDGNLVLKAESTLYRVHRSLFMLSPFFASMLELPATEDGAQGDSDENPIDLYGSDIPSSIELPHRVTAEDFEELLTAIYPVAYTGPPIRSQKSWARILNASGMLQFDAIRANAMVNLASADPLLKIELGDRHHYTPWILEGFKEFSLKLDPLPKECSIRLDQDRYFCLVSTREAVRNHLFRLVIRSYQNNFSWDCPRAGVTVSCNYYGGSHTSSSACPDYALQSLRESLEVTATIYGSICSTMQEKMKNKGLCDNCSDSFQTKIAKYLDLSKVDSIVASFVQQA